MKFVLLFAAVAAVSLAAPDLPTTFEAQYTYTIKTSSPKLPSSSGTGTLAEDNENKKKYDCTLAKGRTTFLCRLTDYNAKMIYIYGKDSDGKVVNCTSRQLPANASTYRNEWIWLFDAKNMGSGTLDSCSCNGDIWELKFEGKIDLKVCVNGNTPGATDYKLTNSTGFAEKISCFTDFSTNPDPSLFTPPSSCKPGLSHFVTEEEEELFFFDNLF